MYNYCWKLNKYKWNVSFFEYNEMIRYSWARSCCHISFSGFIGLSLITGPDPELMKNRSPKALGGCGRSAQDAHSSMAPNLTSKFLEGFCLLYYCFAFFLWTFKFGFEHCLFSLHISSHNSFIKIVNSYALSRTAFFNS